MAARKLRDKQTYSKLLHLLENRPLLKRFGSLFLTLIFTSCATQLHERLG